MRRRAGRKVVTARSLGGRRRSGACAWRDCNAAGCYEVGHGRRMCCMHAALTLLARVIGQTLAAENNARGVR